MKKNCNSTSIEGAQASSKTAMIKNKEKAKSVGRINFTLLERLQAVDMVRDMAFEVFAQATEGATSKRELNGVFSKMFLEQDKTKNYLTRKDNQGIAFHMKAIINEHYAGDIKSIQKMGAILAMLNDDTPATNKFVRDVLQSFKAKGYKVSTEQLFDSKTKELEGWQVSVNGTNAFDSISAKLRTDLAIMQRMKKTSTGIEPVLGFLNSKQYYPVGTVWGTLIKLIGNSPNYQIFKEKWEKSDHPIIQQLNDKEGNDLENLKTQLFNALGQNVKYDYYKSLHEAGYTDKNGKQTDGSSLLVLANEENLVKVIERRIYTDFLTNDVLLTEGEYDDTKIKEFNSSIQEASTLEEYNTIFKSIGLIPREVFVDNLKALRQQGNNLSNALSQGKDPFGIKQTDQDTIFVKSFAQMLTTYENSSLNNVHINSTNGKVYEYNRPNYLTRFVNSVKYFQENPSNKGNAFLSKFTNDPFYKSSLLFNNIKENKVDFVVLDSIQMPGKKSSVDYSSMDEKALALQQLSAFNSSANSGFFIITNPVHSDAGIQTGLKINNKPYKVDKDIDGNFIKGEAIKQLHLLAKRERYAINNRLGIEHSNKHVMFPYLNNLTDAEINSDVAVDMILEYTKKQHEAYKEYLSEVGVRDENGFVDNIFPDSSFEDLTAEYLLNNLIYQTEAIWLLNGDPSFYGEVDYSSGKTKGIDTFYKRAKQIWSPVSYLRVGAKWTDSNGNTTEVQPTFNTKVIKEIDVFNEKFLDWVQDKYPQYYDNFKKGSSLTDAQSYIDPIRFKEVMIGLEGWNDDMETAYQKVLNGTFNQKDRTAMFPTQKPFYFDFHNYMSSLAGNKTNRLHPFQNKDSEFILQPMMALEFINGKPNDLFNPMHKYMLEQMGYKFDGDKVAPPSLESRQNKALGIVDKFTFDSAVKVGNYSEDTLEVAQIKLGKRFEEKEFNKELDTKLRNKLKKLFPEINLEYVDNIDPSEAENVFNQLILAPREFTEKLLDPSKIKTLEEAKDYFLFFEPDTTINIIKKDPYFKKYNLKFIDTDSTKFLADRFAQEAYVKNRNELRRVFTEFINDQQKPKSLVRRILMSIKDWLNNTSKPTALLEQLHDKIVRGFETSNYDIQVDSKKGKKIIFEEVVESKPIGKHIIENLGENFRLTGSLSYAPSGNVYRDPKGMLHDIDVVSSKSKEKAIEDFKDKFPYAKKIYDINSSSMVTYIVSLPNHYVTNIKQRFGTYGLVTAYDVVDKSTGNVVGTFRLDYEVDKDNKVIGSSRVENKTGVESTYVDVFYDQKEGDTKNYTYTNSEGNQINIKLDDYLIGFSAKVAMARQKDKNDIQRFNQEKEGRIVGQAQIGTKEQAAKVLIDAANQKQDTLPHEYAHHYIAMFRESPMVQEGIKRWGSEEALVQAIGEQVVAQKGEALNWWNKFVKFILDALSDKEVLQVLTDSFLNKSNLNELNTNQQSDNSKVISMNNEAYGKQVNVPSHFLNDEQKMAVQVRKNIIKNINKGGKYTLPTGEIILGRDVVKRLNNLEIQNIREDLNRINKRFTSLENVVDLLRTEIGKRNLSPQLSEALEFVDGDKEKTRLPLSHPAMIYQIRQVLHAVYTKQIIEQKLTSGVSYTNLSGFGFKNQPRIVYDGKRIKHYEAYAPIHNKALYSLFKEGEPLLMSDLKEMVKKGKLTSEQLRMMTEGITWRIPNEELYSNFPIKIIGFFPTETSGALVLPPELTTISGFDFDIDKVFGFYYNFYFKPSDKSINRFLDLEANVETKQRNSLSSEEKANYKSNLDILELTINQEFPGATLVEGVRKILESKDVEKVGEDGVVTNINPLGDLKDWLQTALQAQANVDGEYIFPKDNESKAGRHNQMLDLMKAVLSNENTAQHMLKTSNFTSIKNIRDYIVRAVGNDTHKMIPNLPQTHSKIANRMLVGKALIGPLANINSMIAVFQQASELEFTNPFKFNNRSYSRLNRQTSLVPVINDNGKPVLNEDGTFVLKKQNISDSISQWVAAIVDNGKDPLAGDLNLNWATIDVFIAMLSVGVDMDTALQYINQEDVRTYAKHYARTGGNDSKTLELMGMKGFKVNFKTHQFSNFNVNSGYKNPVIRDFLHYKHLGKKLTKFTGAMKVGENGLGPSTGSLEAGIRKVDDVINDTSAIGILGSEELIKNKSFVHNQLIEVLRSARNNLGKHLININKGVYKKVLDTLEEYKGDRLLTQDEIDKVVHSMGSYLMASEINITPDFLRTFPAELIAFRNDPKNKDYEFLLEGFFVENNVLAHKNRASTIGNADEIKMGLMNALIEEHPDIAKKLGMYEYALDGFGISYIGFSNLITTKWYETFVSYDNKNTKSLESESEKHAKRFIDQYVQNNWRKLTNIVPMKYNYPTYITEGLEVNSKMLSPLEKPIPYIQHKKQLYKLDRLENKYKPYITRGLYFRAGKNILGKIFELYSQDGSDFMLDFSDIVSITNIPTSEPNVLPDDIELPVHLFDPDLSDQLVDDYEVDSDFNYDEEEISYLANELDYQADQYSVDQLDQLDLDADADELLPCDI